MGVEGESQKEEWTLYSVCMALFLAFLLVLPQFLKGHGYATGAAVSTYVLRYDTGLGGLESVIADGAVFRIPFLDALGGGFNFAGGGGMGIHID